MNAKKAVELIRDYGNHIYAIEQAEEKLRDIGEDYTAGELRMVVNTLRQQIEELEERLESTEI